MVCAEAQAVAKPVVAFSSGGIPEIVSHAHTGFLAKEGNWQSLGEFLFLLLENAELRQRFGRAGRDLVLRQFDLEHCTGLLEQTYRRVLSVAAASNEGRLVQEAMVNYSS
jgi:glycosyltransferase involved in cell wall biosynthesis